MSDGRIAHELDNIQGVLWIIGIALTLATCRIGMREGPECKCQCDCSKQQCEPKPEVTP